MEVTAGFNDHHRREVVTGFNDRRKRDSSLDGGDTTASL